MKSVWFLLDMVKQPIASNTNEDGSDNPEVGKK